MTRKEYDKKEYYARKKSGIFGKRGENGLCYNCGREKALEGKKVCQNCYDEILVAVQKSVENRKEAKAMRAKEKVAGELTRISRHFEDNGFKPAENFKHFEGKQFMSNLPLLSELCEKLKQGLDSSNYHWAQYDIDKFTGLSRLMLDIACEATALVYSEDWEVVKNGEYPKQI